MNQKMLAVAVTAVIVGVVVSIFSLFPKRKQLERFFSQQVCQKNILKNYGANQKPSRDSLRKSLDVYEEIRSELHQYDLTDYDVGRFRKANNFVYLSLVAWLSLDVLNDCSSCGHSKEEIGFFISDMIGMAGTDREKLRAKLVAGSHAA